MQPFHFSPPHDNLMRASLFFYLLKADLDCLCHLWTEHSQAIKKADIPLFVKKNLHMKVASFYSEVEIFGSFSNITKNV